MSLFSRHSVFVLCLLASSSAGLAFLSLAYGDFAPMWRSFPPIVARGIVIDGLALLLLAASFGLFRPVTRMPSLAAIVAYQAVWAAIAVPPILAKPLSLGSWYGCAEAATALAAPLILYAPRLARPGEILFGITCIFYGWSHFIYADYTAGMVPAYLPAGLAVAYFTGAAHICAGLAIVTGVLARLASLLEAAMMSLFGLLVWVPSFFADPKPSWAASPQNQWSELAVNLVLVASAGIVAISLSSRAAIGRLSTSR
jgi:uncharacterized membrane protein YphA (DoxX/SURF4 family)